MYKLRAYVNSTKNVHDISDYNFKGSSADLTSTNGKTYGLDDCEYLIIPVEEFKTILGIKPKSKAKIEPKNTKDVNEYDIKTADNME